MIELSLMSLVYVCVVIPIFYFPGLSQRGAVNLVYLTSTFDKWCFISNYCIIQVDE